MTRAEFAQILTEEGYSKSSIEEIWAGRESDDLDPEQVRSTAKHQIIANRRP